MTLRLGGVVACLPLLASLSVSTHGSELRDPFFGEALFYAHQELYFDALERVDAELRQHRRVDEPDLDSLWYHLRDAEFSLGDFELRYRMHHRAGRAITAVLEGAVDEAIRNDAAFRLARIHFQKGQYEQANQALDRIEGRVPSDIRDDIAFLRANVLLAQGQAASAIPVLKKLEDSDEYRSFAAYNLGIALRDSGQIVAARSQLTRAGQMRASGTAELGIRDKSNLVLGTLLMESGQEMDSQAFFERVRLDGPYSNQALLNAGWAYMSAENYERALVPFGILASRNMTDRAVQEATVALPYAYGKLGIHGRAAVLYGDALDALGVEIGRLGRSIDSIRQGHFIKALAREEVRKDKNWVIRLRSLANAPETFYLMDLMASHDFQTGLQNYLDMVDLVQRLDDWERSLDAWNGLVSNRRQHYAPLLPGVDDEFRELDSRLSLRREQYAVLKRRRDELLTMPRPEFLATPEEMMLLRRLEQLEAAMPDDGQLWERARRLEGIVWWQLRVSFHDRLERFDRRLRELKTVMEAAVQAHERYVRARQAATHSFTGFDDPLVHLETRIAAARDEIDRLMTRQARQLERVAIERLSARRQHLENQRDRVRYALADSYDRAAVAAASGED